MKKFIYIFSTVFFFIFLVLLSFRLLSPYALKYILEKAINGNAQIEGMIIGFQDKVLKIDIKGVKLKGDVDGEIKTIQVSAGLKKGLYLNSLIISDFEISIKKRGEAKTRFFTVPAEMVLIKDGIVVYESKRFILKDVEIKNLIYRKPFTFKIDVQGDYYFQSIKATGEGIYSKRNFEIKGDADLSGVKGDVWSRYITGDINYRCRFIYEKGRLTVKGPVLVNNFSLKAGFLSKPIMMNRTSGNLFLNYSNNKADIKISGINFKDTNFNIDMRLGDKELESIVISSGFIEMDSIKDYLSLENFSKEADDALKYIDKGRVRLNRVIYNTTNPFSCDISLKDVVILYDDMMFDNVEGHLIIDETRVRFDDFYGRYKTSNISNISGDLIFAGKRDFRLKGNFYINLVDIPSKLDLGNIKFKRGFSKGSFELEKQSSDKDYRLSGRGILISSEVLYNNFAVQAKGLYKFTKDEIEFDPLEIQKYDTRIKLNGKWRKDFLGIRLLGNLNISHIKPFINIPFDLNGTADINIEIKKRQEDLQVSGFINMDDLYYKIENYIIKNRGVKNTISISASKSNGDIEVGHLDYNLEGINLKLTGRLKKNIAQDVHLILKVPEVDKAGYLFFFSEDAAKGLIDLDITIKEFAFPVKKMPLIYGTLKIDNGYLKVPVLPSPLSEVRLESLFNGDSFHLKSNRIRCGRTLLNILEIESKGTDNPEFTLTADIENFDYSDFETPGDIEIYPLRPDTVLARANGEISIRVKKATIGKKMGDNVLFKAVYGDRKINISEIRANALDGDIEGHGALDLSGTVPIINITGKMKGISSGEFLKLFGAKTHIIESKEFIFVDIDFKGNTIKDFAKTLSGKATIYSENGVIKKMNLLSKIFGLLNVYELLRGRVDLAAEGFQYKKTGANFVINNGIFRTDDYIIDSPAMVITAQGSLNLVDETMDAKITVSPLVTIDRIVSNIPVLRNILQDKKRGFIYAVYDVKGPIDDPEIKTSYIQTIGSLPLNILRGLIQFPMNLFKDEKGQ
ncbi:MAG: AsmA-like C-terminal domain-containing protein [Syntrophorhabdaceae bacterium]|nr:AsmA-like C-terminal domain-containing protein [Syntrophorhabdaceae bacterium]